MSPKAFVAKHLFDRVPHAFESDTAFTEWKTPFCAQLGVDPRSAYLVGSGAVGISLNPVNNFSEFHSRSDIDVAIVSANHFEMAWMFLRTEGHMRRRILPRQKIAWDRHQTGLVFWGAVEADKLLALYPFGATWLPALVRASTDVIGYREVKVRIYKDLDALKGYQMSGARKRREELEKPGVADA